MLLDATPPTAEAETEPAAAGTELCADEGEMVEDEGGTLTAGGSCEGAVSWADWAGGLGSLVTGTADWDWWDTGGGETLPVEGGEEDVAVVGRDTAGSEGPTVLVVFGPSPGSVDRTAPGSGSVAGGSMVLPLSTREGRILLNACWRVPDGADRESPNVIAGDGKKKEKVIIEFIITTEIREKRIREICEKSFYNIMIK